MGMGNGHAMSPLPINFRPPRESPNSRRNAVLNKKSRWLECVEVVAMRQWCVSGCRCRYDATTISKPEKETVRLCRRMPGSSGIYWKTCYWIPSAPFAYMSHLFLCVCRRGGAPLTADSAAQSMPQGPLRSTTWTNAVRHMNLLHLFFMRSYSQYHFEWSSENSLYLSWAKITKTI